MWDDSPSDMLTGETWSMSSDVFPHSPCDNSPDERMRGTNSPVCDNQPGRGTVDANAHHHQPGVEPCFHVLGVSPNASLSEIRSAYRKLVLSCHPDKVQGSPEEKILAQNKFAQISAAYGILTRGEDDPGTPYGTPKLYPNETCYPSPYELFRNTFGTSLPPNNSIIIGDSTMLFHAWTRPQSVAPQVAGYLTNGVSYERPTESSTVEPMITEESKKRHMQDSNLEMPFQKRQAVQPSCWEPRVEPIITDNAHKRPMGESDSEMPLQKRQREEPSWARNGTFHKRDMYQLYKDDALKYDYESPSSKRLRMVCA
jgi:hypothetical protein